MLSLLTLSAAAVAQEAHPAPARPAWRIPSDDEIHAALERRVAMDGAGMVVGVIEDGRRRVVAAGQTGEPGSPPPDGDTIFQVGSLSKPFAALLLADMVTRGEVRLQDPLSNYMPKGVTLAERGRPITLEDLALHVSGLPSMPTNFPLRGKPDPLSAYSESDLRDFLRGWRPGRAPGEKWEYANLGVSLLGRALAQRENTEYEALLKQRVLQPLGMNHTAITLTRAQQKHAALGLDRHGEPAATWEMRTLPASGSLRSSANDLLTLISVWLGRESPLGKAAALQMATRSSVQPAQALGLGVTKVDGREIFAHEGATPGFRAYLAFDPSKSRGIVILENASLDERPGPLAQWLLVGGKLPPAKRAAPRAEVPAARGVLDACEGRYQLESGRLLTVVYVDDHLVVDTAGAGPLLYRSSGDFGFFEPAIGYDLVFKRDAAGRVAGVEWYERGKEGGLTTKGSRLPD
jgi:D-alanyl-D-alanine-carboxypeptidase/D-alanyl-D-alanine-endopeptidase